MLQGIDKAAMIHEVEREILMRGKVIHAYIHLTK